jgi:GNAT superfamily N-acetyltransferase
MLLRAAQPLDAAAVARVHVRSWQAAYRGLLADEYLDALRPEDRAERYTFGDAAAHQPVTIVAIVQATICGFATTGPSRDGDQDEGGEVQALYVDPEHWGTGIGRALIHDARARLAEHGFGQVSLWVLAGNERAERFYRVDGWVPDGSRRQAEIGGASEQELRYRRSLP